MRCFVTSLLLTVMWISPATDLLGQSRQEKRAAKRNFKEAEKMLNKADVPQYREALEKLEAAHAYYKAEEEEDFYYYLAVCYLNTIDKTQAIPHLKKLYELDSDYSDDLLFLLAVAYQLDLQFDKAIDFFERYRNSLSNRKLKRKHKVDRLTILIMQPHLRRLFRKKVKIEGMRPIIDRRIKECKVGKRLLDNPKDVEILNIGSAINSVYPDYGSVISADESVMYFTSRRPNTTGGERDPYDGNYFEDVYVTYKKGENEWTKAANVGPPVNTDQHEGVIGLSADGQKLFLFKNTQKYKGSIFYSELEGEFWSDPVRFDKPITSEYFEFSASMSGDQQKIYFISTRPGGYGGRDIYVSEKNEEGEWGKVQNLGDKINTTYDEDGVFMHPDGRTLYFSSRGHNGMGGHDVFKSTLTEEGWSKPKNMGYPINTPDNDIYFVLSADGQTGYYTSARPDGRGEKDIYMIKMPKEEPVAKMEKRFVESGQEEMQLPGSKSTRPLTILKGVVVDAVTGDSLGAQIEVTDNEANKKISTLKSNSKTGKFLVTLPSGKNYGVAVDKEGYAFHSENFDIPEDHGYREVVKVIELNPIKAGTKIVLNNIFFDFDKATLREQSEPELDRVVEFLGNFGDLKVEISGHTDSKGKPDYNRKLSERRAQAVVDYLVKKGVDANRLKAVGYGAERPVAPNTKPDGSDNPDGRQLNRRTELEILDESGEKVVSSRDQAGASSNIVDLGESNSPLEKGLRFSVQIAASTGPLSNEYLTIYEEIFRYKEGNMWKYLVGNFDNYAAADKFRQKVINKGIEEAFVVAFHDGKQISLNKAKEMQ